MKNEFIFYYAEYKTNYYRSYALGCYKDIYQPRVCPSKLIKITVAF